VSILRAFFEFATLNRWGEYWGEMGYARVERGVNLIAIESACAWATLNSYSVDNEPCTEDGASCGGSDSDASSKTTTKWVQDPSRHGASAAEALRNRFSVVL
jgi:hypothetical protein